MNAIEKLEAKQKEVREFIKAFGPISKMSDENFDKLKSLNAEVSSLQNEAFEFHTVGLGAKP